MCHDTANDIFRVKNGLAHLKKYFDEDKLDEKALIGCINYILLGANGVNNAIDTFYKKFKEKELND